LRRRCLAAPIPQRRRLRSRGKGGAQRPRAPALLLHATSPPPDPPPLLPSRSSRPSPRPPQAHETALSAPEASAAGGSAGGAGAGESAADAAFRPVLDAMLEPLLELAARSAAPLARNAPSGPGGGAGADPTAHHVYLLNCLAAVQARLAPHACAGRPALALAERVEGLLGELVAGAAARIMAPCGAADVVDRIRFYRTQPGPPGAPLSADAALSLAAVVDAMRGLVAALSAADALPEFPRLLAPKLRSDATARVARALADAYELAHATLDDPTAGYAEHGGAGALKHTPQQVRTILGVV